MPHIFRKDNGNTEHFHNSQITTAPTTPFPAIPWQRLLTVEIFHLHALRFYLHSLSWRTQLFNWLLTRSKTKSHYDWRSVSQSVSLGVEPLMTRYLLLFDSYCLVLWGALSDEMTGLSFVHAAGPHQRSLSQVESLWTRDHILLSQIWDFHFRRLLRFAGSR
jgi:hypothetical protein